MRSSTPEGKKAAIIKMGEQLGKRLSDHPELGPRIKELALGSGADNGKMMSSAEISSALHSDSVLNGHYRNIIGRWNETSQRAIVRFALMELLNQREYKEWKSEINSQRVKRMNDGRRRAAAARRETSQPAEVTAESGGENVAAEGGIPKQEIRFPMSDALRARKNERGEWELGWTKIEEELLWDTIFGDGSAWVPEGEILGSDSRLNYEYIAQTLSEAFDDPVSESDVHNVLFVRASQDVVDGTDNYSEFVQWLQS